LPSIRGGDHHSESVKLLLGLNKNKAHAALHNVKNDNLPQKGTENGQQQSLSALAAAASP